MSLRDELIHNEIQHLGQMLQTLSYELTILQDFIKDKFGSDFESFRENLTCAQQHSSTTPKETGTSSRSGNITARKSTSKPGGLKRSDGTRNTNDLAEKRHKDSHVAAQKHEESDSSSDEEKPITIRIESVVSGAGAEQYSNDEENSRTEDGADDDDNSEMEFPIDEKNVIDLMDEEQKVKGERIDFSTPPLRQRKPRSEIWTKFVVTKLPNGKFHVRCPICKAPVSSKSSRMEKHFKNCRQLVADGGATSNNSPGPSTVSSRMSLADEKRETFKAMRQVKKEKLKIVSWESRQRPGGPMGPGRRLDPVWAYFNVTDDPETGKKVAICKQCESRVSNRVHRIRRHFIICHELEKEEQEQGT
ncbi:hypothetical protein Ocin01_05488 [Orchesella cincta]|uniref:BED-type domain-containing protein n=1 Tax=Orchesella cincta TaxID=48709 RepID=A0A1D2N894_ORCCI|nr:hypothetical protein Ocin01_05488 [Orchesella cincta]